MHEGSSEGLRKGEKRRRLGWSGTLAGERGQQKHPRRRTVEGRTTSLPSRFLNFPKKPVRNTPRDRYSGLRINLLVAPSQPKGSMACCDFRPRIQRRVRAGFSPDFPITGCMLYVEAIKSCEQSACQGSQGGAFDAISETLLSQAYMLGIGNMRQGVEGLERDARG